MKIDNIEIELAKIKLKRPYTIAYKTTSSIQNIFIKIILNNGMVGFGSSNVSKYVVGLDTSQSYKNAINFKNELIGKNISYLTGNLDKVENEFINDPGSKAAYNIALYDAFCKFLNISLGLFLGRKVQELPTSITVGIKDIDETIEEINEYYDSGFRFIKVKLGDKIDYDIERITKINEKFGSKIKIRIDANQGWSIDDTTYYLRFHVLVPEETKIGAVDSLKVRIKEILKKHQPKSIGEARALPGMTPAAASILLRFVKN